MPLVVASGPPLPPLLVPQAELFGSARVAVPYQAMSTRPSSPAVGHTKTLLCSPGVGIVIGGDQVVPSFVEKLYLSRVSPVIVQPTGSCGACSQTAYKLPALSIAMAGKFPPVFAVGHVPPVGIVPRVATGRSLQLKPLGSLVNGTRKQRPIRILLKVASS